MAQPNPPPPTTNPNNVVIVVTDGLASAQQRRISALLGRWAVVACRVHHLRARLRKLQASIDWARQRLRQPPPPPAAAEIARQVEAETARRRALLAAWERRHADTLELVEAWEMRRAGLVLALNRASVEVLRGRASRRARTPPADAV